MDEHDRFDGEERLEALRHCLGMFDEPAEKVADAIGISAIDIQEMPLAKRGLGGSEMLGWLSIHSGPHAYFMEVLVPEHYGDWGFFSGLIRGYYNFHFLEWRGSLRRKFSYIVLGIRQPAHWLKMYCPPNPFAPWYMPIHIVAALLYAVLFLAFGWRVKPSASP